ncbi:glycosyltransferase family 4 protein [Paraburkholderia terricola]|uniref:Glycosyltransferase involved in cell wall bisynthesis n=1 Tax=Paraburkholderia terricola TaxID=169427 RepID=A0A1M6MAQ5_9BURK|nr:MULTISPECIES: glycosyltransferase family 4 protein [Paraburkholderia]SDN97622.1 Glycosyltransferase involved in cell wall bisynthesis [Paraburkholderia sediminicola]SHJ80568.1 Glycosyltransferase involved in cell wall bisynthesis [Paraburkholderia terricola]
MRILQLVHAPRLSGAEVLVKGLAIHHQRAGHEVCVASLLPQQDDFAGIRAELQAAGVTCLFPRARHGRVGKLLHLYRVVRQFRPDFIVAHATLAALYVRLLPVHTPIAWVMHSGVNDFENGALKRAERLLSRRARAIIGVSQQNIDDYLREIGTHPSLVVIPNGVDASQFAEHDDAPAPGLAAPAKQIVQLGRYIEGKSQLDTVRAFERVVQSEPDARLLLCGVVEDPSYHEAVLSLVTRLGLESKVTVCGPRTDVAAILGASRVFAMPSRFEAQSIGFLEALASGIPVVASRIPSFGFASGFAGVSLVDTTDCEAYGRALLNALDMPRAKRQLAGYTLHDTADRYMTIARKFVHPLHVSA